MGALAFSIGKEFFAYADEIIRLETTDNEYTKTKRKIWKAMGDYLETNNYPKHLISKKIRKTIEERIEAKTGNRVSINTGHFQDIMQKNEWTDQSMNRNNLKNKNNKLDPETGSKNSSLNTNFKEENQDLIRRLDDFTEQVNSFRGYVKENSFLTLIDERIKDDIFTRLDAFCKNFSGYLNNKQAVPENAQLLFLILYNAASDINNLFGLFFEEVKRINLQNRVKTKKSNQILTSKEMGKFTARDLVSLSKSLEFATANEARLHGFYGQQCPYCKGYRTKISPDNDNQTYCVRCVGRKGQESFPRQSFITCTRCRYILTKDQMKDKNKCPSCSLKITLPVEMLQQQH